MWDLVVEEILVTKSWPRGRSRYIKGSVSRIVCTKHNTKNYNHALTNTNNLAHKPPMNNETKVSARFVNVFVVLGTGILHYKAALLGLRS